MPNSRPLIAHVVNAFRIGGLENGLVNLINQLPSGEYRHCIICLTSYDDFAKRIRSNDVRIFAINKKPGKDPMWYLRMWRLLHELKPSIVHTRNLATIESQFIASLLRVPGRIHGEHGWDTYDLDGTSVKYRLLRRIISPFIHCFIPLSKQLESYLIKKVSVPPRKVARICNGVDNQLFTPRIWSDLSALEAETNNQVTVGYLGRMEPVKDPLNLLHAFIRILGERPELRKSVRLIMVGDGSLYDDCLALSKTAGIGKLVWLPGQRNDTPELLRKLDIFVLPSRAEGISNTILEAMSTGLPIVATKVGGNSELVDEGKNGFLIPPSDSNALAFAIIHYIDNEHLRAQHGAHSRLLIDKKFSLSHMAKKYSAIYDRVLTGRS